jgi:hypothetical protein
MAKTYSQIGKQIQARILAVCPLHQAAIKAGVPSYPVPLCNAGFTGHHLATTTGRCVDCARLYRVKVKNQKAAAAAAKVAPQ